MNTTPASNHPSIQPSNPPCPLVSIVIALPAPTPYLDETLAAIGRQTYRPFEVILLPDAPSDRAWPTWCTEVPTGKIRPAEKRNLGIARVRGEIIAFLDDDAWPADDWLERAMAHFAGPAVLGVGGPAITPPNDPFLARMSGRVYGNRLVSGGYRIRYVRGTRVCEVDDYPSCNFFVRTEAVRQVHGFRTDFWPGEDTYLCMELTHRLGGKIVYEPAALAYHHRRELFLPHLRQIGRYGLHRGYFARHFPATSRRIGYLMPSVLAAGTLLGGLVAWFWAPGRWLWLGGLGLYLLITFLFSASANPIAWLTTWLGMVATHYVYGVRFLIGFFTSRLPGSVQKFDHPSERPVAEVGR